MWYWGRWLGNVFVFGFASRTRGDLGILETINSLELCETKKKIKNRITPARVGVVEFLIKVGDRGGAGWVKVLRSIVFDVRPNSGGILDDRKTFSK